MALDYDKRTDFRAFDVLIDALDHATPGELKKAIVTCKEQGEYLGNSSGRRAIWKNMATLLRKIK